MKRREFITILGGAAAWPIAARAQQGDRVRRIGVLMVVAETDPDAKGFVQALETRLDAASWHKGRNLDAMPMNWCSLLRTFWWCLAQQH